MSGMWPDDVELINETTTQINGVTAVERRRTVNSIELKQVDQQQMKSVNGWLVVIE